MILKRCHIDAFGTLSNFDYEFAPGLTVLLRENGFGKSTFAAFIKAMFYGLQKDGNSLEKNERKRFEPWQGGKFGGFLEFSARGKDYRVIRSFGKTAAKDTFSLLDLSTGAPSGDFSERLGEELFQLDAKSFARSTYLSQFSDGEPSATTSIQAKLSGLVEDTDDLLNFDTAMKDLKEARKRLGVSQKAGIPVPDALAQTQKMELELAQAQAQLPELERLCGQIDGLNQEKEAKSAELRHIHAQFLQASQWEAQAELLRQAEEKRQRLAQTEANLRTLDAGHPKGYPSLSEIEAQKQQQVRFSQAEARLRSLQGPQTGEARFPEEKDLAACEQTQEELRLLRQQLTVCRLTPEEENRYQVLRRTFASGVPSEEEILDRQRSCRRIAQLEGLKNAPAQRVEPSAGPKVLLLILGGLLILVGLGLLFIGQFLAGRALLALGLISLVLGLRPAAKPQVVTASAISQSENQELYDRKRALSDFLLSFYADVQEPEMQLSRLLGDRKDYLSLREKAALLSGQQEALRQTISEKQALVLNLFEAYFPGRPYEEGFVQALRERAWEDRQRTAALAEETRLFQSLRAALEAFANRFGLEYGPGVLNALEEDARTRQKLAQDLDRQTRELEAFRSAHPDLQQVSPQSLPSAQALSQKDAGVQAEITELDRRLSQLRDNRNALQRATARIPDLQDQIAALRDSGEDAVRKYTLLSDTMSLLDAARENLANSYVGKVKGQFLHYADTLLPGQLAGFFLDKDLTLRVDALGNPREAAAFSAGTLDCLMLCMRLALVDALFPEEKPCLILDDPFVNLDDAHTQKALALLKEIAKGRQVVYLVCNSSRSI